MNDSSADPTTDNALRYAAGTDHVESWFMRANHPSQPRALWLKATILGEKDGDAVAEAWCSLFDGSESRARGEKTTVPFSAASFDDPIAIDGCRFDLSPGGGGSTGAIGDFSWDLTWRRLDGHLGEPLCLLPTRRMIDWAVPKNKLLTPAPALLYSGTVSWGEETWEVSDWLGMQGHNWGKAHSPEYAWGQCNFVDSLGEPFCSVEGASGRIVIAGRQTPVISLLNVRRNGREYRFNRVVDLWNQDATIDFPDWTLKMKGRDGEALLSMRADPANMVCLGYYNPGGELRYCLNSKLAAVTLRVNPVNEDAFECHSDHGGALEFLQREPAPQLPDVV